MRRLELGDLLIVTRLDRLARSTRDLLNILHALAEKGAKFKSLHDPWCDTSTPQGELLVTILAGFATFERHLIKARTDDGRKRAQARGVRFGRDRVELANACSPLRRYLFRGFMRRPRFLGKGCSTALLGKRMQDVEQVAGAASQAIEMGDDQKVTGFEAPHNLLFHE